MSSAPGRMMRPAPAVEAPAVARRLGLESLELGLSQLQLWLQLPLLRLWIVSRRDRSRRSGSRHDHASHDRPERGNWPGADGKLLHHTCENLPALQQVLGR
jgi:hypothetical protein